MPFRVFKKHIKINQKNIPLFFQKHHEEFLKTSNVFQKTFDVFFKTTVVKNVPSSTKHKLLRIKQIQVYSSKHASSDSKQNCRLQLWHIGF